jgi:hypothetical protein
MEAWTSLNPCVPRHSRRVPSSIHELPPTLLVLDPLQSTYNRLGHPLADLSKSHPLTTPLTIGEPRWPPFFLFNWLIALFSHRLPFPILFDLFFQKLVSTHSNHSITNIDKVGMKAWSSYFQRDLNMSLRWWTSRNLPDGFCLKSTVGRT